MKLISVTEVQPGDLLDLEHDPYADTEKTHASVSFLYAEVVGSEQETPDCVRIDFEGLDSFGFPTSHEVYLCQRDGKDV